MSVIKAYRNTADCEYVKNYHNVFIELSNIFNKVSKRRQKILVDPIQAQLIEIEELLLQAEVSYYGKSGGKKKAISDLSKKIIRKIELLEQPIMMLFSFGTVEKKKREHIVGMLNDEMKLLKGNVLDEDFVYSPIWLLNFEKLQEVNFLNNMKSILRTINSKVIKAPQNTQSSYVPVILELAGDAYYNLIQANKNVPETKEQYEIRRDLISDSIGKLNALQKPLSILFEIIDVGKDVIKELSDRLDKEIVLLKGLQASDKERFAKLK